MKRNEELIVPLATLREMFEETKNEVKAIRMRSGVPHPLSSFTLHGEVKSCPQADMLMDCLNATAIEKVGSIGWRGARWFLLESTMFFEVQEVAQTSPPRVQGVRPSKVVQVLEHILPKTIEATQAPQNLLTFERDCEKKYSVAARERRRKRGDLGRLAPRKKLLKSRLRSPESC